MRQLGLYHYVALTVLICPLLAQAQVAGKLAQESSNVSEPISIRASNPCPDLAACVDSILANARDFDLRPSFEAMQKIKSFPRADREQSLRAKAGLSTQKNSSNSLWREELEKGNLAQGIAALRNAILLASAPAELNLQLGTLLLQNNDAAGAEQAFLQGIKFAPYNSALWEAWGQANLLQNKQELAVRAILVGYEWSAKKSASKARFANLARDPSKPYSAAYTQVLEAINQRNMQLISAWGAVNQQAINIVQEHGHKKVFLQRPELRCAPPEYPLEAARKGEQGDVRIDVLLDVDGTVLASMIDKSSSFAELDNAARLSLSACYGVDIRISGALKEKMRAKVTYQWKLEN